MKISCPRCQQHYSITDADLGRNLECICGYKFLISEKHELIKNDEQEQCQQSKISDYHIIKPLGNGGVGQVFLADHPTLNIPVAIKILSKGVDENLNDARRFVRESQLAAQLNHPNILRIFDSGIHDGRPYYVMEYTDKGDLAQKIELQNKLNEDETRLVALAMARALKETHKQNIIHRDIKPENILLGRDGQYKLADLGLAKEMNKINKSLNITGINTAMGTPHFMPPEQALNAEEADIRSDIYALGISLYQCITGKLPFDGKTTGEILNKQITKKPMDLRVFTPEVSEQLAKIITKCLAKDPDQRFQTPSELEDILLNPQVEVQMEEPLKNNFGLKELSILILLLIIIICCSTILIR